MKYGMSAPKNLRAEMGAPKRGGRASMRNAPMRYADGGMVKGKGKGKGYGGGSSGSCKPA